MSIIVGLASLLLLVGNIILLYNRRVQESVAWFLCFISLFGIFVLTPLFISKELERKQEANHSKHIELLDPTFDYCPYCGVELE